MTPAEGGSGSPTIRPASVHHFVFRDAAADQAHSESAGVKKFAAILCPECLAPVEFTDYRSVIANLEIPPR